MSSLHVLISWTLLLTLVFLRHSHALCTGPWYGTDCANKCRCQYDSCNTDGTCKGDSSCYRGWFGPSCQYRDFSSVDFRGIPSLSNDSDPSTCWPNKQSTVVSIFFSRLFHFTWLRMTHTERGNFTIKFNNDTLDCLNKRTYVISSTETDVSCELSTEVDQIYVRGDIVQFLCNIFVSMGRNMALRQPTYQTSILLVGGERLSSEKAVDGLINKERTSCAGTGGEESVLKIWQIFYRRPVFLYHILLYNRGIDSRESDLGMTLLETFNSNNEKLQTYTDPGTAKGVYYVSITTESQPVSRLSVEKKNASVPLYICEIETYGDMVCPEGKWGPNCENYCACGSMEFCSSVTGKCSPGCTAGFYGPRCDQSCSSFCDNQDCHYVTGECFQCVPGHMGVDCDVACPTGTYGVNCSKLCSDKCLNSECLPNNGTCLSCPDKFYSRDCSRPCSDKCDGELCYQKSGVCKTCKIGFFTDLCNVLCNTSCEDMTCNRDTGSCGINCPTGKRGLNCALDCPPNCEVCDSDTCFKCSQSRYGDDCSRTCPQKCDGTCEIKTGHCLSCFRGFYGNDCEKECPTECEGSECDFQTGKCDTSNSLLYIIAAAAIAGFLLAFAIIGCIILYKRKRTPPPKVQEEQAPTEQAPDEEVPREHVSMLRFPDILRRKSSTVSGTGTWV